MDFESLNAAMEKEMATHSSILVWKIPWTEEPHRLYRSWGRKKLNTTEHKCIYIIIQLYKAVCPEGGEYTKMLTEIVIINIFEYFYMWSPGLNIFHMLFYLTYMW